MDKKYLMDTLRRYYPDIKPLRKQISAFRVRRTSGMLLDNEQVVRGEQDEKFKSQLVKDALSQKKSMVRSTFRMMKDIISRCPDYKDRTDLGKLKTDIIFCRLAYGFQPDEYLCFDLENKSMEERRQFISDIEHYLYLYRMNDLSETQIFNNKGMTYKHFGKYYHREVLYLSSKKDLSEFRAFVSRHSQFVRKAVYEGMGRSVALVDMNDNTSSVEEIFEDMISHGPHVVEERVIQNEALSALNPSSVNTIRCITLNTRNGVVVAYCFMKIGQGGSFIDNGGAGGILVGIDHTTGILDTDGYDELNKRYETHPDTGIRFAGYQLPEFQKMLDICCEMSALTPRVKCIGWDMAYTDNGWVVIEGNGMTQMIGPQIVWKRGIKSEMLDLMKDMDLIV